MDKLTFLGLLRQGLNGLPQEDIEERIGFYSEMIDDRMEEGLSEAEAVAGVGSVEEIVPQIIAEIPLQKLVREKVKPKRSLRAWEIVLLVLGSPIWLSLLIAAAAVLFSIYVVLWSLILALFAVELSFIAGALGGAAVGIVYLAQGKTAQGFALLGAGLVLAGLSVFLFFGCIAAVKGTARLTKKIALWIKSLFIK